ncbi:hypothetical protein IBL26_14385 [Roseomonas aerophila]|uniref:Uncharacterized protein n=1 Tax=Teichococcus aerophilus TaxID=1224513 RepID=A0ABR7RPF5_9PROT|nr:hypothetical protein [Pseudoroseomonas aerophila]MBC9208030.1 hypothetical protein [Pseudoroseomonas aerophila]
MKPPFEGMLMAGYHQFFIAEAQVEPEAALRTDADLLASGSVISAFIARNMPGCANRLRCSVAWGA